jgi:hypothetical protein
MSWQFRQRGVATASSNFAAIRSQLAQLGPSMNVSTTVLRHAIPKRSRAKLASVGAPQLALLLLYTRDCGERPDRRGEHGGRFKLWVASQGVVHLVKKLTLSIGMTGLIAPQSYREIRRRLKSCVQGASDQI